jgi:hypothetical protein
LASYRSLTATYYPEYAASAHAAAGYIGNGYFDVASPRSLASIPYEAASQFNRYFEPDKVDCKYNPNSDGSPKEFQQPPHGGQPHQEPPPSTGKNDHQDKNVEQIVKCEPNSHFAGLPTSSEDVVVDLGQFVTSVSQQPLILVRV